MSIPENFRASIADPDNQTLYFSNDQALYGKDGTVVDIQYYKFNDMFELLAEKDGLRMKNVETYRSNGYQVINRGNYLLAMRRGSAVPVNYQKDVINIHVEGKTSMYQIVIKSASAKDGYDLGTDGFTEKRIELARNIFNSIK